MLLVGPHHLAGLLRVHRLAYTLTIGDIPPGYEVHHLCEHPWCVRPSHLLMVTRKEHSAWGRCARAQQCPRGHPYDAANTERARDGHRSCRMCHRRSEWERKHPGRRYEEWLNRSVDGSQR